MNLHNGVKAVFQLYNFVLILSFVHTQETACQVPLLFQALQHLAFPFIYAAKRSFTSVWGNFLELWKFWMYTWVLPYGFLTVRRWWKSLANGANKSQTMYFTSFTSLPHRLFAAKTARPAFNLSRFTTGKEQHLVALNNSLFCTYLVIKLYKFLLTAKLMDNLRALTDIVGTLHINFYQIRFDKVTIR